MAVTDLFQVRTYAEELYTEIAIGGEPGAAPLRVLPGMALTAWLVFAGLFACAQLVPVSDAVTVRPRYVFRLGAWRWPLLVAVLLGLAVLWAVPVGNLCQQAGVVVTQVSGGRERHWSVVKLAEVLAATPRRFSREFLDTAIVGLAAATASLLFAVALAWLARRGGLRAAPAFLVTACLLAIPGPVFGIALIWLLNRPDQPWLLALYDHRFFAPVLALALRGLPLSVLVLWHALRTLPEDTLEMAAIQGAGPLRRILAIGLPQRWAALPVAWLVALAVAWGDLGASVLIVPPGTNTLAIRIAGLAHFGVDDQLAGISLWVMALFAILGGAVLWLMRKLEA
jgi:iron(III) transport system permease protein